MQPGAALKTWGWLWTVAGATAASALGDIFAKRYAMDGGGRPAACACGAYLLGSLCWLAMLRRGQNLAQAGMVWVLAYTVTMLLVSQAGFHEPLSARQWAGAVLGLAALALML